MPQPWLAAAWYCAVKADTENAVSFADKAIMLQPQYSLAYLAKGRMLMQQGSVDSALIAFSQAHSLDKDLTSLMGLVEANISLGKFKEAANWSRESVRLFPKAAQSYFMMGNVLAKSPNASHEVTI